MKESPSEPKPSLVPAFMGATAVALGLVAAWVLWTPDGASGETAGGGEATAVKAEEPGKPAAPKLQLEERGYPNFGFHVSLESSWKVDQGGAGVRVTVPEGRFHVLRTAAPTKLGETASPPGDQEVAASVRVAGTDILCTVDPGAGDEVRAYARQVCPTVRDAGAVGMLKHIECKADTDIDLESTSQGVEAAREEIRECFTAGHRGDTVMTEGTADVAVEPSPDGVPLNILVGADVPTETSFKWMRGCLMHVFRKLPYIKRQPGNGMFRCTFHWSLE